MWVPATDSNSPEQPLWAISDVQKLSFTSKSPPLCKNLHLLSSAPDSNSKSALPPVSLPFCICSVFSLSRPRSPGARMEIFSLLPHSENLLLNAMPSWLSPLKTKALLGSSLLTLLRFLESSKMAAHGTHG